MNSDLFKKIRFFNWLVASFIKKNLKVILISFFVSFMFILGIISLYPYLAITFSKKEVIGLTAQINNFDKVPSEILTKISNGLFYINEKGDLVPVLVDRWERSKDGLTYKIYLKKNIYWSDSKLFTAQDIDYTFKDVEKKILDEHTIQFILKKPLPIFPIYLNKPLIRKPLVGIGGLYQIGKIKIVQGKIFSLTLIPNTKDLQPIIYKFYNNENQLITAYKKGEIKKMKVLKKSIADQFNFWKNTKVKKVVDYSYVLALFFNFKNHYLKEKELRQVLISSIDYQKFNDYGEAAKTSYSPLSFFYNPKIKTYLYEPEKNKRIIEKLLPNSATLSAKFVLQTYSDYYDLGETIVNNFNAVGFNTQLNIMNYPGQSNFDLFLTYIEIPKDPDQYYFWHSTQKDTNIGNYNNPRVDKLLEDGRLTLDVSQRKDIYFKLQEILQNDPPAAFLFYPYYYLIERK